MDCPLILEGISTKFEPVIQRSGNFPLLPDRKLLPDQMQKLLPDSEASVNFGAPVYAEAPALLGAPVATGAPF